MHIDAGGAGDRRGLVAALPVLDTGGVFPTSRHSGTTALTFLYVQPSAAPSRVQADVRALVRRDISQPGDRDVGATGLYSAEQDQGNLIAGSLNPVQEAAVAVVFIVVAVALRSPVAPLVMERRGPSGKDAARWGGAQVMPLVTVAGVTVAAGTATLMVARLPLYSELGPGMAISVAIAFIVSLTFLAPAMALLGRALSWPVRLTDPGSDPRPRGRRLTQRLMGRPVSVTVLVLGVAALGAGASQVTHLRLGLNLVTDLPSSSGAVRAATAAAKGFVPGIVAPTAVMLDGADVGSHPAQLATLQGELAAQPGVAGVLGPADTCPLTGFGRSWEEANRRRLSGAVVAAVPGASTTITRAGVALTFALLALVPIGSFESFGLPHRRLMGSLATESRPAPGLSGGQPEGLGDAAAS